MHCITSHQGVDLNKDGVPIGDLRMDYDEDWVNMEMISIDKSFQRQGIGLNVYQALLDAAIEAGYDGLKSHAFDTSFSGQQRSPSATGVLNKLLDQNGGTIVEITPDPEELEEEGAPFYGPPYHTYYIDKSGKIKKETE